MPESLYHAAEIWKEIPGYEKKYEVSSAGRVRRVGTRYVYKPNLRNGYENITLYHSSGRKRHSVHALVALAFLGPPPKDHEVNHRDGVRSNNNLWNLEYVTRQNNVRHAWLVLRGGRRQDGPRRRRSPRAKRPRKEVVPAETLAEIKGLLAEGCMASKLAKRFGLPPRVIWNISAAMRRRAI